MPEQKPATITQIKKQHEGLQEYLTAKAGDAHLDTFTGNWIERRPLGDYNAWLPRFEGIDFKTRLTQLSQGAVWLDYGCGDAAIALTSGKESNPHIIAEGVTYPVKRDDLPEHNNVTVYRQEGNDFLAHRQNYYDLITSVQALRYAPDQLSTLKRAYRALKEGGVLLVDMILNAPMPLINDQGQLVDPMVLEQKLKDRGYQIEMKHRESPGVKFASYSFAIRKTPGLPRLKLPIKLIEVPQHNRHTDPDGDFDVLGDNRHAVNYVYQLV